MQKLFFAAAMAGAGVVTFSTAAQAADWQPTRPIEFIASAGAGGGTDVFARTVQTAINKNKLLPQSVIVTNKGGGSGAEAFVYAKTNAKDPYKVYFGTQDVYLLPIGSKLSYTPADLTPVISMLFDPFLLWVQPESGITDVASFVAKAKASPSGFKAGGAKAREADETLVSLIKGASGINARYIPYKSGSEVATQLAGKHLDFNVNNPAESVEQWRAGAQRPLCVFSAKRMPGTTPVGEGKSWSDIPTCKEAGLNVRPFEQPRTIWLAANMDPDVVAFYKDLFRKVTQTPEWKSYVERSVTIPTVMVDEELRSFIATDKAGYEEIFGRNGWSAQ
ncbi:Bug family tripartite tricarboxylate transporter substrate binding protein [Noviherbaspirillum suwonense]|uniref:Tripartite-type tricarboxylate transporter, receptor component TctC n=1 Tax=Noviherbaspirillum suwonense TaxID=1224511 RepID=A0ABY1QV48_9BURK|nr:tripartite tricarboxylate transporter substrate-binding protein [Noviherbaspirillum suwonense]SMP79958.1 Tripartite-type tricarboxylate transporter, receptor component TctC [Noviherbaspirillum suwonense]